MRKLRLTCVVGARPNFIKVAAIMAEVSKRAEIEAELIHTGQHSSPEMSDAFFRDLEMSPPNWNLGISGGSQTWQTAEILQKIEPLFQERRPDALVVVGDVTSTLASALAAVKLGVPVAHVEAGLRSFDRSMPEEVNRIITDAISSFLFVSEPSGRSNLLREGVSEEQIFFPGNVMIDTLLRFRARASESEILDRLGLTARSYVLVTLHRPSNVDNQDRLKEYMAMLSQLAEEITVVFPVHPRTLQRIEASGIPKGRIVFTPPQSYLDFLRLTSEAKLVMTDSGGIQEETTILRVPCLTMRENTERPITIEQGSNRLAGVDPQRISAMARDILSSGEVPTRVPEKWDGQAAKRIVDTLEQVVDR